MVEQAGGRLGRVVAARKCDHQLIGRVQRGLPVLGPHVVAGVHNEQLVELADDLAQLAERACREHLAGRRGLVRGQHVEHRVVLRAQVRGQFADAARPAREPFQVAQQVAHRAAGRVRLGAHAQRPLRLVVVPGQHEAAPAAPERHAQHERRHGLAGAALGVDDRDLPEPTEVPAYGVQRVAQVGLVPAGAQPQQAERAAPGRGAGAGGGRDHARAHPPPRRELLRGRRPLREVRGQVRIRVRGRNVRAGDRDGARRPATQPTPAGRRDGARVRRRLCRAAGRGVQRQVRLGGQVREPLQIVIAGGRPATRLRRRPGLA
ncbi:hypothetical protein ACFQX7_19035 [Luedemannella flava]